MPIQSGSRLGPYEVFAPIGAGGTGVGLTVRRQLMKVASRALVVILAISILPWFSLEAQAQSQGASDSQAGAPVVSGKVYSFEKIADGVYYATSSGPMNTGGNHPIIVNERDVMVVDAGTTPAAARALLEDLRLITNKPVRWVVNTHFHYDHTDGNSIFGPDVEIIGHEFVRHAIMDFDVLHREPFKTGLSNLPIHIESLKKQIADEKDAARRATLEKDLAVVQADWEQLKTIKPTPPTMTYSSNMTLYSGQREVRLLFLGRGHTQGDTVVFLPKERIVCTGDLMESRPAYMGDAVFDEWITTLDALKELDFDTVLPGHGVPFHEKSLITAYQGYLRDLMTQVATLRKQGLSADQAAQKVDLTSHKADFPQIQGPGADVRGVRRMYEWMDERRVRQP
jgi:glyoxylase-like metal-dependent hydrolase (beta-lactamase superfamily II)